MTLDVNQRGCFAEYKFAVDAMEHGLNVCMPLLDSSKYDCIVEYNGNVKKIQIKSAMNRKTRGYDGTVHVVLAHKRNKYTQQMVDFFAIYCHGGFYIVKNEMQRSIRLKTSGKYKNNFCNFAMLKK